MADGFNSAFKGLSCYWSGRQQEVLYVNCFDFLSDLRCWSNFSCDVPKPPENKRKEKM
jgi:hypothetical protein